jgi:cytochrome P450
MGLPAGPASPGLVQTFFWIKKPIELMRSCRRRFGRAFTIRINTVGDVVLLSDPEAIRQVFTGESDALRAGSVNAVLRPLLGDASVLLLDGSEHLRQRKLLLPPFHGENLRRYAGAMREIAERVSADWPRARTIVLRPAMQRMTLEIILRVVFGFEEGEAFDRMRSVLERLLTIADSGYAAIALIPALRRDLPGFPWRRFLRDRAEADALVYDQIRRRKRALEKGEQRDDVLDLLLMAKDEAGSPLEEVELRDELMTLLVAGHETTATALCWSFERILRDDRVHRCLVDEIDRAAPAQSSDDDRAGNFEYLDATIKEALRTRPIVPIVGRRVFEPQRVAGHDIPVGAVLAPCIYLAHHEGDLYPEPDAFRPERFVGKRPDPYAWFPFGGGIRRCLGMAFALLEMRLILAHLFARFSFRLEEPREVRTVRRAVTFAPEGGVRVRVEPRNEPRRAALLAVPRKR